MKFLKIIPLTVITIVAVNNTILASAVATQFNIRPQSFNTARKVSGEVPGTALTFLPDQDSWNSYFGLTLAYNRSFKPDTIARSLFGDTFSTITTTNNNDCNNECNQCVIQIQGTDVVERNPHALLADYFYLPSDYNGAIAVKPTISNVVLDFNKYIGLDAWCQGLYLRVYAPFVHTKWNLGLQELPAINGGSTVEAGKFSPSTLSTQDLLTSPLAYFAGDAPTSPLTQANNATVNNAALYPITRDGLCFGKMVGESCSVNTSTDPNCCDTDNSHSGSRTRNAFGEIRAELGYNFLLCDDYHLGIGIEAAAPTAGRPHGHYLFDAMVGNGGSWELGGLLTAHHIWWRSTCEDKHVGFYLDANLTHLFSAKQHRTFDLKGKPLSRYMVAALHGPNTTNLQAGTDEESSPIVNSLYQFAGVFTPVANLTAQEVKVSVGVQADIAAWINYTCGGFSVDLGYNYFGRSCESIDCGNCPSRLATESQWALKGDANVFGYVPGRPTPALAYPLAISESAATIHTGTQLAAVTKTYPTTGSLATPGTPGYVQNNTIDNVYGPARQAGSVFFANPSEDNNINTNISFAPVFLTTADIDYEGNETSLSSNKVFAHLNYKWDRECWSPYIGIGGEAEFGQSEGNRCATGPCDTDTNCCQNCRNIAISQWGVWFKTGVAFN